MSAPSPAQRRLIVAVANAVAAAGGERAVLGNALAAAGEPFNARTRDACIREGWLERQPGRPPTYLVTTDGYTHIAEESA